MLVRYVCRGVTVILARWQPRSVGKSFVAKGNGQKSGGPNLLLAAPLSLAPSLL